jgi:uncharacterized membrane protein YfcA
MEWSHLFLLLLPIVAFLYASVGHGGASGYLALMALFSFAPEVMKPTALLLNLFVAGISFLQFARAGHFKPNLFLIFALLSVPLSFLGGITEVDPKQYKIILGILLVFAIVRMLGWQRQAEDNNRFLSTKTRWGTGLIVGGAIGYFSGLIGIGGGIILSPVILLLGWGTVKQAAAVSALFIWVNSAAGLSGQLMTGITLGKEVWVWVLLAATGGWVGAYFGSFRWTPRIIRYMLAFVLLLASVKLIWFGV